MNATIELLQKEVDRLRGVILDAARTLIDHEVDGTIWINAHTTLAEHLRIVGQVCPLLRGERPLFPESDTVPDDAVIMALTVELDRERSLRRDLECRIERMDAGLTLEDAQQISDGLDHLGELSA